jgi:ribosomal protein S18 acetylase RimI-like enzyme
MTEDYFFWMDAQIQKTCNFSIEEITGMSIHSYIASAMKFISPKDQEKAIFHLLVKDGVPVAMGGLRQIPNGHAEIVRIYTKPECRGQGYGSMMIEMLIVESKRLGFKMLNLDTGIFMKDAQSMYASHGFEKCDPYAGAEPPPQLFPYWLYMQLKL